MDEKTAIARLKGGDIGGLEVLVRTYQVQAMRAVDLITRDVAMAQDIVQAAFIRVYQRIDQFDTAKPFGPWFMRICINDAYKAVTRRPTLSLDISPDPDDTGDMALGDTLLDEAPGPESQLEINELKAEVWEALGNLSPAERAVIVLRYFLEFSEKEMAETLDQPVGTVKWRLHQARQHLRVLLQPLHTQQMAAAAERSGEKQ